MAEKVCVLVVEDEGIVAKNIEYALKGVDHFVVATAASGEEAIRTAQETVPDVILMDIKLRGGIDGIETARRIRQCRDIPIVYLTSYADEENIERAKDTQPYGYIVKPFKMDELYSAITLAVYKHKMFSGLNESEVKYRTVFDHANDAIFLMRNDIFTDCNAKTLEMFRCTKEQIIGQPPYRFSPAVQRDGRDSREKALEKINNALKGEPQRFEWTHCTYDGMTLETEVSLNIITVNGAHSLLAVVRDITERKRAGEELIAAHRQLYDIIDFFPDATFVLDKEQKVIAWNKAIEVMTGVSKEEIMGKGDHEYAIPFYGERRPILVDLLFEKDVSIESKYDFVKKAGDVYYVEVYVPDAYRGKGAYLWATASQLYDHEGNVTGAIESIRDITERKKTELLLRESEEKYRNIFENAPYGIFQTTPEGRFISVNPSHASMMGFSSPDEMIDTFTDIGKMHYVDQEERERYRKLLKKDGMVKNFEAEVYRKDKSRIWVSISAKEIRDKNGKLNHYEGMIENITERKQAQEEIRKSYQMTGNILEKAPFGVYIANEHGQVEYANQAMSRISGVEMERLMSVNIFEVPQNRAMGLSEKIAGAIAGNPFTLGPVEYTSFYGGRTAIRNYTGIPFEQDRKQKCLVFVEDVTEQRRTEKALIESEKKFRGLFEESRDAIYISSGDGRIKDWNRSFIEIFGYTEAEISFIKAKDVYARPDEKERFKTAVREKGFVKDMELKLCRKDGTIIDALVSVATRRDDDGKICEYQGIIRDITEKKKAEEEIWHRAYHDLLTGLPNRLLMYDRYAMNRAHAQRFNERIGVVVFDLDRFKDVNDTRGHETGDLLLRALADRLSGLLRKMDTIARIGGDEFMIIFPIYYEGKYAKEVAEKIMQSFKQPFIINGKPIAITASFGIAIYPDDGEDIDTLMRNADMAMYAAKKAGRNTYRYFSAPRV